MERTASPVASLSALRDCRIGIQAPPKGVAPGALTVPLPVESCGDTAISGCNTSALVELGDLCAHI